MSHSTAEAGAPSAPVRPRAAAFAFTAHPDRIERITLRAGALTVLTLGVYRFWMKTALRRLIWGETRLDGDPFEYDGTPVELLIGTMMAVVALAFLLGGANLLLSFGAMSVFQTGIYSVAGLVSLAILAPLVQFAVFRARRYRLLRTRWRGIRFGMDGSARTFIWIWARKFALSVVSLGVLYPYLRVARERYMTECMLYGDARFRFEGSAKDIFLYWMSLWMGVVGGFGLLVLLLLMFRNLGGGMGFAVFAMLGWLYLIFWLYCRYRAAEIRLFMSARRLKDVRIRCSFTASDLIWPFWALIGRTIIPGIPVGLVILLLVWLALNLARAVDGGGHGDMSVWTLDLIEFADFETLGARIVFFGALWINYGLSILLYMWLWYVVYWRRVHEALCAATVAEGLESLDAVRQRTADDQIESEGFADALDVGGL